MADEYISREAAMKALPDDMYGYLHRRILRTIPAADVVARDCFDKILAENDDMRAIIDTYGGLENIQSAFVKLHEIETVDVVPVVHGKWIELGKYSDGYNWRCSVCKRESVMAVNYCPYCGADMREVEHENG